MSTSGSAVSTTLHLVRHAEPGAGGEDPGLSERGRDQAVAVGRALRTDAVSEVLHSEKARAVETAWIVAKTLGVAAAASPFGKDLTPIPEDWQSVPAEYHERLRRVPEVERDVGGRQLDLAFDTLGSLDGDGDRTIVMVTHNFVIGWFVRRALDAPWWRWIGLNHDHAAVTTIQWNEDTAPRLVRFNSST